MGTIYTPFIDVSVNAEWDNWQKYPNGRPNSLYSKEAIDWNIDGLVFGFITLSAANNTACWAAQASMPLDWAKPLADDLHSAGKHIIISFGGAANSDISKGLAVKDLITTYQTAITDFHASGLDFDLENGLYDINKICQALGEIQAKNSAVTISFTLPTMPTGLTSTGLSVVSTAVQAGLNFVVNGMSMDYYDANYTTKMGQAAIDAATSIVHQLAKYYPSLSTAELFTKVATTPMIGLNDDLSMFTLTNADEVSTFARKNNMAFIGAWSFNRDNPSGYKHVDLTTSSNPAQKVSGEYSKKFMSP